MVFTISEINLTFCELLKNYGWINSDKNNNVHFSVDGGEGIIKFIYEDIEFGVTFDLKDAQNCTNKKQLQRLLINSFVDQMGSYCDYLMKCKHESELEMREIRTYEPAAKIEYRKEWRKIKGDEQIKLENLAPDLSYQVAVMERDVENHLYDD